MKTCFKCGLEKDLSEYYTHPRMGDGHLNKCKQCCRHETRLRFERLMANNPEWRLGELKRQRETARARRAMGLQESANHKHKETWRRKNQHKANAHNAVHRAVKAGKIQKEKCWCGQEAQAHHEDYEKPLDVIWLCPKHHAERHLQLRGTI